MTTPDPKSGQASPPGELQLGAAQVPRVGETPQYPTAAAGSSPGFALAGARVPGGPSLPELDPMALTRLVSELANHLFAAPPNAPGAPTLADAEALSSPPSLPSAPTAGGLHGAPVTIADPTPAGATSMAASSPHGAAPHASTPYAGAPSLGAPPYAGTPAVHSTPHAGTPGGHSTPYAGTPAVHSAPYADAPAAHATPPGATSSQAPPATAPYAAASPPAAPYASAGSSSVASPTSTARPARDAHPIDGGSPFLAPLDLDAIARLADPFASPAMGDPRTASRAADAPPAQPAGLTFDTFEIVPTDGALARSLGGGMFDANVLKREFPILSEPVRGKRLVWLDNAATTQKPKAVIDRLSFFYEHENSNIHRAAHTLAAKATDAYESARESVRRFIHAPSSKEIVFVRGTTEGINLVSQSWGRRNVSAGDEIVITWLEHHANIVPWQQLCSEKGAKLRVAPVDSRGQVILEEYEKLLNPRTKLVSFTQVSNALGTITPAKEMIEMAHRHGALVLLDGAQSVSHMPVDVQQLGCDFFVFSGHKVFAPTGIGVVWGKSEILDAMPPWQGGGNMIQDVTFERTLYQGAPARFEAGTGNIADAVGLGAALDWLMRIGVESVG
ncbi:MAG TPA: aminotransferase class V-fold PLP-dependent enzyme, partial [Labilithrix sp.]